MYALTSGTVRRTIPLEEFVSRYQGIVDRAELQSVRAEITGAAGDTPGSRFASNSNRVSPGSSARRTPCRWSMRRTGGGLPGRRRPSSPSSELTAASTWTVCPPNAARSSTGNGEPLAYDGQVERVGIVPGLIPAEDEAARSAGAERPHEDGPKRPSRHGTRAPIQAGSSRSWIFHGTRASACSTSSPACQAFRSRRRQRASTRSVSRPHT